MKCSPYPFHNIGPAKGPQLELVGAADGNPSSKTLFFSVVVCHTALLRLYHFAAIDSDAVSLRARRTAVNHDLMRLEEFCIESSGGSRIRTICALGVLDN